MPRPRGVVLTDDRYAEFIPDLRAIRVVARDGAKITVAQSGDAARWLFKMPIYFTFEVNETPPNSLQSRTVAGSVRVLASSSVLVPVASGVRLDYAGQIVPGFELVAGGNEHIASSRTRPASFQALVDAIDRRSTTLRKDEIAEGH